jgi:hypothetical protein
VEKLAYTCQTAEFAESKMLMCANAGTGDNPSAAIHHAAENWQFHLSKDGDRALRKSLCDAGMAHNVLILTNGTTLVVYPGLEATMSDLDGFAKDLATAGITGLRPEPNCPT